MRKTISCAALAAAALCSPLFAEAVSPSAIRMNAATMKEMAAFSVPPHGEREERDRRREYQRPLPRIATSANAIEAKASIVTVNAASAPAPALGVNFRAQLGTPGTYPADASGAVGPVHIVSISNTTVVVHDRTGKQLASSSIDQFFHDPSTPDGFLYDPRVTYDKTNDRWILLCLYDVDFTHSALMVAVTASGDPSATWNRYRIAIDPADLLDGDFTRVALTRDSLVVTTGTFAGDSPVGTEVFIFPRTSLRDTRTALPYRMIRDSRYDLVPVTNLDDTSDINLVDFPDAGYIRLFTVSQTTITALETYRSSVYFDGFLAASGPQLGVTKPLMDVGDIRLQYCIVRDGTLWVVHQAGVAGSSLPRSVIALWTVPLNGAGAPRVSLLDEPTGSTYFSFPSLAVNRNHEALIGFCRMSATQYPSAAYLFVDSSGAVRGPVDLKAGEGVYYTQRWGDYTTAAVDPMNDRDFWLVGLYPSAEFPSYSRTVWAMWWGTVPGGQSRGRVARH
ncbi:MAG: hypothetical protein QOI24_254 [Acidobacteriota bacterium]|jgi:hypothetical protein|nr:hypothetical protein [Acidobacteriota bacterium]